MNKCIGSILVMDDEADVRETMVAMLMKIGYDVQYATNGQDAVEMCRTAMARGKAFDLLIMDLSVPGGIGGQEALQQIHAFAPDIQAIVTSGYSSDPIMMDFRSYGFSGAVPKPYRVSDLTRAVHAAMGTRDRLSFREPGNKDRA